MKQSILFIALLSGIPALATAQNYSSFPVEIGAEKNLNSDANDYAPFATPDGGMIFFNSGRKEGSFGASDVYRAKRVKLEWKNILNAGRTFNTDESDGSLAMAGDGKTVVFASDGRRDGRGDEDIYMGTLQDGELTDVRNLGARVNSRYWESQPTISKDGNTVYFASNRPGGQGGTDIWYTTRSAGGEWSEPANPGRSVNSKGEERSPHITPDGGTLFFSSNGFGGYGGFDVYMSLKDSTNWLKCANLGQNINTSANELFFYPPFSGEKFYFASDRGGGMGKLDIYSGTPNIYGSGNFQLTVFVQDSTTGQPIPATVAIMDIAGSTTVSTFFTNSTADGYSQILPATRAYRVIVQVNGQPVKVKEVRQTPPNTEQTLRFLYGPVSLADFDLGRYNIPFFVTGYYRPNTPENLENLFGLMDNQLSEATYIEEFKKGSRRHQQYIAYSKTIDGIFRTVYKKAADTIFPRFAEAAEANEILEIAVTGYADPQPLIGTYVERDTATFEDVSGTSYQMLPGTEMDNFRLSGLRAWYSGHQLEKLFDAGSNPAYADLKRKGRIRYRYIGGGVSGDSNNYAVQRRIHIQIRRVTGATPKGGDEFDSNASQ